MEFSLGHGDLANDGYNFMITGSYQKQQELRATQRDFSASGFDPARGYTSTNNPGSWPGTFLDSNGNEFQSGYPACVGNPLLTTYFGNCAYRVSSATDLLPKSSEASAMVSFIKALPANNTIQLQYFYTQSEVTAWSGPMFYFFPLDQASPYYPTGGTADLRRRRGELRRHGTGSGRWRLCDLDRPRERSLQRQHQCRAAGSLTFAGSNGGWDYTTGINWSKNNNDNRNVGGYPDEKRAGARTRRYLSDLINPFGPAEPAGQALINSSYVNGVYALGEDTRWSVDAHASHPLGDAFNAGNPATFALGASFGGEHFQYATTPYNDVGAPPPA